MYAQRITWRVNVHNSYLSFRIRKKRVHQICYVWRKRWWVYVMVNFLIPVVLPSQRYPPQLLAQKLGDGDWITNLRF